MHIDKLITSSCSSQEVSSTRYDRWRRPNLLRRCYRASCTSSPLGSRTLPSQALQDSISRRTSVRSRRSVAPCTNIRYSDKVDDWYFQHHCDWFNASPFREANAQIPQLNIWGMFVASKWSWAGSDLVLQMTTISLVSLVRVGVSKSTKQSPCYYRWVWNIQRLLATCSSVHGHW